MAGSDHARIAVIGNAGGGKSTLARALAQRRRLPHVEVDRFLWREGWVPAQPDAYERQHALAMAQDRWIIDGLGRQETIAARLSRASEIVLVDMPLWMHFWLAAERQVAWSAEGPPEHAPAGAETMPPTRDLFRTIWEVDQAWMPGLRAMCREAERQGKLVTRLVSVDELDAFARVC